MLFSEPQAAVWYAAADGSSTNGTYAEPWSVPYSVGKTPNPYLHPGDTVIFKNGGPFMCNETNTDGMSSVLLFRISGTPSQKITYRAESLWGFTIDGGLEISSASNLVVRDLWIYCSELTNRSRTNRWEFPAGINDAGVGNEILHNLVDNTGHPGIASWKTTKGKYIAGNIIRFCGYNDWTTDPAMGYSYKGANRGSGMYLQNLDNSAEALIEGNISYYTYTTGMKAYGNTDIWGFRFLHNICVQNPEAGVFYHQDNYPSAGVTVVSNYMWTGSPIRIGYPLGNGNHSNAVVAGNYVVSTNYLFYQTDGWVNCTWTNNVGVKLSDRYPWFLEAYGETNGIIGSHHIDNNVYCVTNYGITGANPFQIKESYYSFGAWQALIHGDTNSVFAYTCPTNLTLFAFRPSTDSNFVHVAVYNWSRQDQTWLDLRSFFQKGDGLSVYDAQDIPNAYTNLVYSGGSVALDLTRTNRARMLGSYPDFGTNVWSGFDPRFRAFVIYRQRAAQPPVTLTGLRVIEVEP
jgi:uncharacterized protein YodC (DUF2158 family)